MGRTARALVALFACILVVAFADPALAFAGLPAGDDGWEWQNPTPQGNDLHSVCFTDAYTGWAVGNWGTIIKTTNGGATWSLQKAGFGQRLSSVYFIGPSTGWAVGSYGTILKTTNGGTTWTDQTSGTDQSLTSVHFIDADTGWAVGDGGTILKTTNGGSTWTAQSSGTDQSLTSVHFIDADTGWAVGGFGTILKTTDGGANWGALPSGTTWQLCSVHFADADNGWAVGDHRTILTTTNGGATWSASTGSSWAYFYSVKFIDADVGWAVGQGGTILKTTNGGVTWNAQNSGTDQTLYSVHFSDEDNGWAVGYEGLIFTTTNGGATWTSQSPGTRQALSSVDFIDAGTGWAVGGGGTILKTTDGGENWTAQSSGTTFNVTSVDFIDAKTGWALGGGWGSILKTTDGGATWDKRDSGLYGTLYSVHFTDADTGWAVGDSGLIFHTTDGGETWTRQFADTDQRLMSVDFADANTGWAVSDGGIIVRTTNGGQTWIAQSVNGTWLQSVYFLDKNTGWAVGKGDVYGVILKTTDGGITWNRQETGTETQLTSVHFTDANTGWAVGYTGTILATTDGGTTWTAQSSGTHQVLSSVHFANADTGWAVGMGGVILKLGGLPDPDPVPAVVGNRTTEKPVLVLVGGFLSDTGYHPVKRAGATQVAPGWEMNGGREKVGGPWDFLGAADSRTKRYLGVADVLVMPTARGAQFWPDAVREAHPVIDSTGALQYNMETLARWLLSDEVALLTRGRPIILVGHSYGGVIARSMLASKVLPNGDVRDQVKGIVQFASPNGGTPLPSLARVSSWAAHVPLESRMPVFRDLDPTVMVPWNLRHQGSVGVPVVRFAGAYLPWGAAPIGGELGQWALSYSTMTVVSGLFGGENDWIVGRNSVQDGLGSLRDPRRDFGGGTFASFDRLTHAADSPGTNGTYSWSPGLFQPEISITFREVVPQSLSGELFWDLSNAISNMAPKTAKMGFRSSAVTAKATAMRADGTSSASDALQCLPVYSVGVSAGNSALIQVPLDGRAVLEVSSIAGTPTVTVEDGSGAAVEIAATSVRTGEATVTTSCEVDSGVPGNHAVRVSLPAGVSGDVVLSGAVFGGARLVLDGVGSALVGHEVTLTASVVDDSGARLSGGVVSGVANLRSGVGLALNYYDSGTAGDLTAGDGVYTAQLTPPAPGRWWAAVEARCTGAHRAADLFFDVGSATATITAQPTEATEPGPGDTIASFGVRVPMVASEDGTYTVSAMLTDGAGVEIGTLHANAQLRAEEATVVVPSLDGEALSGIAPGPLTVSPIQVTHYRDGVELPAGSGPGLKTRSYAPTDFYAFSISLEGPVTNPSPVSAVRFIGTALNTSSSVAAVEYSLDGAITWHSAAASDGTFNSQSEDFAIDLDLPDYVYGIHVRQRGADGIVLPVEDWAGRRFAVDTVAPEEVSDLVAVVIAETGLPIARASWLPSDPPSTVASPVRYVLTLAGVEVATTYDTGAEIPLPDAAVHTLAVTPVDAAGNVGAASIVVVDARPTDMAPPVSTLRSNPPPNAAGWNNSATLVSLDATDGPEGSGVAETRCSVDSDESSLYTDGFAVATEGVHTIKYSSTDAAGNREETHTASVRIDTTDPVTTSDAKPTYISSASIKLAATDAGSSVAATYHKLDGGAQSVGTTVATSVVGNHAVQFWSVDVAGNIEAAKTVSFTVTAPVPPDTTAPTTTSDARATYVSSASIGLSATDAGSGVAATYYRLDNGVQVAGTTVTTKAFGSHTLSFWSVDRAGNTEKANAVTFFVAKPKVSLGTPVAPKTMKAKKSYTVYGSLKPKHTSGTKPVRIYKYKKVSGKWKSYGYVKATASDYSTYTRYKVKMSLPSNGSWRLRAYAPADSKHAATWSSKYDYVTVK